MPDAAAAQPECIFAVSTGCFALFASPRSLRPVRFAPLDYSNVTLLIRPVCFLLETRLG